MTPPPPPPPPSLWEGRYNRGKAKIFVYTHAVVSFSFGSARRERGGSLQLSEADPPPLVPCLGACRPRTRLPSLFGGEGNARAAAFPFLFPRGGGNRFLPPPLLDGDLMKGRGRGRSPPPPRRVICEVK